MSKDEIDRMVQEAEKYRSDDEKQRDRVAAKNTLESYCFNVKQTMDDEKVKPEPETLIVIIFSLNAQAFVLAQGQN